MTPPVKIYSLGSIERRSGRVIWLLEEIGIAYKEKILDFDSQEHKQPEYLKINPMGTVPTVECGGKVLIESAAICTYFADKYKEKNMAPATDSPNRGEYMQWMFFATTMEYILTDAFKTKDTSQEKEKVAEVTERFKPVVQILTQALENKEYLVNNTFSAADIMISSTLHWAKEFQIHTDDNSPLNIYMERLKVREAAKKAGIFVPIFD